MVESKKEGETVIMIVDQRNKMNFIEVTVRVEAIKSINSIEEQKEANVNEEATLFIQGKNRKG